jgi:futalosine hydrolase
MRWLRPRFGSCSLLRSSSVNSDVNGPDGIRIVEESAGSHAEAREALENGLRQYNTRFLGPRPELVEYAFTVRDAEDRIVGGVCGDLMRQWCYVESLWLDDGYRGRRLGTALMDRVLAFAQAHNAIGIHLDTASFQARGFYERFGFVEFGRQVERHPGVSIHYMELRFRRASDSADVERRSATFDAAPSVLVVAATTRELSVPAGWQSLVCGVGPVDATSRTAAALAQTRPSVLLHVGIAGARRARGLAPGTLIIGTESYYSDLAIPSHFAPSSLAAPPSLVAALASAVPDAQSMPIGTSARVGGSSACDVEAMEGFAVLRAAQLAGVPAIEVRAISNEIEELDRSRWHFDLAFDAITNATPRLVDALMGSVHHA